MIFLLLQQVLDQQKALIEVAVKQPDIHRKELHCWFCGQKIHALDTKHTTWCSRIPRQNGGKR